MTGDDDPHGPLVGDSRSKLEGNLSRFCQFVPTIVTMRRYSCHRLLGVGVAMAAVLAVALSVAAHPASADTLLATEAEAACACTARSPPSRYTVPSGSPSSTTRPCGGSASCTTRSSRTQIALHAAQVKLAHDQRRARVASDRAVQGRQRRGVRDRAGGAHAVAGDQRGRPQVARRPGRLRHGLCHPCAARLDRRAPAGALPGAQAGEAREDGAGSPQAPDRADAAEAPDAGQGARISKSR